MKTSLHIPTPSSTVAAAIAACLAAGLCPDSHAVSLSLRPGSTVIATGGTVSVDVVVSGTSDLTAPSIGAFDLDLGFDPVSVSATSVAFGGFLNSVPGFQQFVDLSTPGIANIQEVSFETSGLLDGNQPDTFVLASVLFAVHDAGSWPIRVDRFELADAEGFVIGDVSASGTVLTARDGTPVPDSGSSMVLLGIGICVVATRAGMSTGRGRRA